MLIFLLLIPLALSFDCIHNQVQSLYKIGRSKNVFVDNLRREISSSEWGPIRIKIQYDDIKHNDIKILVGEIKNMFERIIQVKNFHVGFEAYNCLLDKFMNIHDHDIVIHISETQYNCQTKSLAYAQICEINDVDKRPISSVVNICKMGDLVDLYLWITHEFFHAFGFSKYVFNSMMVRPFFKDGQTIYKLISKHALNTSREYFNCKDLNGVELERDLSHLKKRIYFQDLMSAVYTQGIGMSKLDFMVLHDMPFYRINFEELNKTVTDSQWGKGLGCSFAHDSCLDSYLKNKEYSPFCFNGKEEKCTYDNNGIGKCEVIEYKSKKMYDRYHHIDYGITNDGRFVEGRKLGGHDYMDFCPYYEEYKPCQQSTKCFDLPGIDHECLEYREDGIKVDSYWLNCTSENICSKKIRDKCKKEKLRICELCDKPELCSYIKGVTSERMFMMESKANFTKISLFIFIIICLVI